MTVECVRVRLTEHTVRVAADVVGVSLEPRLDRQGFFTQPRDDPARFRSSESMFLRLEIARWQSRHRHTNILPASSIICGHRRVQP